jgi:hypothetical protein
MEAIMAKSKRRELGAVSDDLSEFIEKLAGIPKDKVREAAIMQSGKDKKGNPIKPLGHWVNGCYYSRHLKTTGAGYYYELEYCTA